ncbi:MAG: MlaD family protein [Verrucomicrobiales bacterium]|nr:MlaD family protein [Verrucomicrobiales bacterium]
MALQDLTPQLRTRLSRMERAVGWFVFLATALLLFGFGYYIYHTAERKGWFLIKANYFTYVLSSSGLNVGDPVVMMGFPVGDITRIHAMPPGNPHNVKVEFEVRDSYFRYIWTGGSFVKVNSADFLGKRQLEITRGTNGPAICVTQPGFIKTIPELEQIITIETNRWQLYQDVFDENSNVVFGAYTMLTRSNLERMAQLNLESNSICAYDNKIKASHIVATWHRPTHRYVNFTARSDDVWLIAMETPPISDQLQAMVSQVQSALPGILSLTNKISAVLDNAATATSNLNTTVTAAQPMLTNFTVISAQLREPGGPMIWALGTNGNDQVQGALTSVDALLTQLAGITSNLNAQVQANTNLLGGISKAVTDADDLVQGLKRHWLLRSAFKTKETNAPPTTVKPLLPPRAR